MLIFYRVTRTSYCRLSHKNNITKEKILFNRYKTYVKAANKEKIAESANKLIEIKYKDPSIYTDMIKISLIDKDTAKAISYIEKGKLMFEDNLDIINQEINIYLAQKKLDQLKEKLNTAIEVAPDNEVLYTVLATIYQKNNELDKAEASYLKAIEVIFFDSWRLAVPSQILCSASVQILHYFSLSHYEMIYLHAPE